MKYQEQKFKLIYEVNGEEKRCYPKSLESRDRNLQICHDRGYKVISCKKLYPFSSERNQHNFELIRNICFNRMHDMEMGDIEWNEAEYNRLSELRDKADKYWELPLPIAWLTGEELSEARELATMAITHRMETCIEHGRYDLIKYCY